MFTRAWIPLLVLTLALWSSPVRAECPTLEEFCASLINGDFATCQNQYNLQHYNCQNFALDFQAEAESQGIPTYTAGIIPDLPEEITNEPGLCGGHMFNIIQVSDPNFNGAKYCVFDAQHGGAIVACWKQDFGPPQKPAWIDATIIESFALMGINWKRCQEILPGAEIVNTSLGALV